MTRQISFAKSTPNDSNFSFSLAYEHICSGVRCRYGMAGHHYLSTGFAEYPVRTPFVHISTACFSSWDTSVQISKRDPFAPISARWTNIRWHQPQGNNAMAASVAAGTAIMASGVGAENQQRPKLGQELRSNVGNRCIEDRIVAIPTRAILPKRADSMSRKTGEDASNPFVSNIRLYISVCQRLVIKHEKRH